MSTIAFFLIILSFLLLIFHFKEPFDNIVPYNSFHVPNNKIKISYQQETERLDQLLDVGRPITLPDYKNTFKTHNYYLTFLFQKEFENFILNYITSKLNQSEYYTKSTFSIIKSMYNIYWLDYPDNSRHFIFNIDLNNPIKFFTRRLKVYIILNNISNYLSDTGEYINSKNKIFTDLQLLYIGTNDPYHSFTINPNDNFNSYYRTLNTLYLLDPFITSNKDIIITDSMKSQFNDQLQNKNNGYN
jgi:hypothetical protein